MERNPDLKGDKVSILIPIGHLFLGLILHMLTTDLVSRKEMEIDSNEKGQHLFFC
jgi:hypothetical protein